jgi:hypothetical protein
MTQPTVPFGAAAQRLGIRARPSQDCIAGGDWFDAGRLGAPARGGSGLWSADDRSTTPGSSVRADRRSRGIVNGTSSSLSFSDRGVA